jgi:hypothetical protein
MAFRIGEKDWARELQDGKMKKIACKAVRGGASWQKHVISQIVSDLTLFALKSRYSALILRGSRPENKLPPSAMMVNPRGCVGMGTVPFNLEKDTSKSTREGMPSQKYAGRVPTHSTAHNRSERFAEQDLEISDDSYLKAADQPSSAERLAEQAVHQTHDKLEQ